MTTVKYKRIFSVLLSLVFATGMLFTSFAEPVWAGATDDDPVDKMAMSLKAAEDEENSEGQHVHADHRVFEKNFCLSVAQKEYTIAEIEKVISFYIKPEMSDLEKYYTLAKWVNQRVVYDGVFWDGAYEFDYYSHQWDAYGCINEDEKSVCAGIAVFYANMCHAADLPCKFVRLDPDTLDHTITYIPDINGNAYYADITENEFLASKNANYFAEDADKAFSGITKEAEDGTYEYHNEDDYDSLRPTDIKECWQEKIPYKKWFREYALHKDTDKEFAAEYEEKGSGESGTHYASYQDFSKYPAQPYDPETRAGNATGIWFLDDFYAEPSEAKSLIENKTFDEQFLNISGVAGNYDCATTEELETAVSADISISYYPSVENNKVVAKAAELTNGEDKDYTIKWASHDDSTGEEVLEIQGTGDYSGKCELRVRMNSAYAKTEPARINGLVYDGSSHNLIEPGEAGNGTMLYAVCEASEDPDAGVKPDDYSEAIPEKTNAGKYDVWYMVKGENGHSDMPPQKLERPRPVIKAGSQSVTIAGKDIDDGDIVNLSATTFTYNGKVQKPSIEAPGLKEGTDYTVSWEDDSSKNAGTYQVTIDGIGNYGGTLWEDYIIEKAANTMALKAKTITVKRKAIKKKSKSFERKKAFTVSKAQGSVSYKLASAKKGKKSFKKKFKINAKTGNVTVKKGLKKGTYKVKVKVRAAGNANYNASAWKAVTFKVQVQ